MSAPPTPTALPTGRAGVLRLPGYRRYLASRAASLVGDMLVPVALAFAVLDLTGSPTDLGLVQAANLLPFLVLALAGGVWADRLPRRRLAIATDLVRLGSQGLMAALLIAGTASVWQLAVLSAAEGAAWAFAEPAHRALLLEVVGPGDLQEANALVRVARSVASVGGPAAAGVLVVGVGPGWAIAVDAATYGVSAACIAAIRLRDARPVAAASSFVADLREGIEIVRSRRWLWVMVVDSALWVMIVQPAVLVLGPVVARDDLGGAGSWATIVTAEGVGAVLGSALGLRLRPRRPLLVAVLSNVCFAPLAALLAVAAPVAVIAAAAVPAGVAMALFMVLWQTALQEHTPPEAQGRVTAVERLGMLGLMPVGLTLVGPVAGAIGVAETLWVATAWQAVSTAILLAVPDIRNLRGR